MPPPFNFLLPVGITLVLWWFSTGLVVAVFGRSRLSMRVAFGLASVMLALAFAGVVLTRQMADVTGVYLAVVCGIVIWGWQTASYYLGFITGPALSDGAVQAALHSTEGSWARFAQVLRASVYHELVVAACALLLLLLTWNQPNRWAAWIYLALWVMHSSARLNVFLGVRNFRVEFLPAHMHPLDALLGKRVSNALFPPAVTLASSITLLLIYRAIVPGTDAAEATGLLLVGTMIGLGVIEHWLMVIPIPATLFGWGMRALPPAELAEEATDKEYLRATPETDWV